MRIALLALCMSFSVCVSAQDYSGVWALNTEQNVEFYSIHQNGDQIVVAMLNTKLGSWMAYQGSLVNHAAVFEPLHTPNGVVDFSVKFQSETQASVEIKAPPCNPPPGSACAAWFSTTYVIKKVF